MKRLARAGAKFLFTGEESGRYHIRRSSQSRTPKLTPRQEEAIQSNWQSGRPIYGVAPPGARAREIRPIAYVWPGDMPSEPAVLEGGIWLEIGLAYTEARFFRTYL